MANLVNCAPTLCHPSRIGWLEACDFQAAKVAAKHWSAVIRARDSESTFRDSTLLWFYQWSIAAKIITKKYFQKRYILAKLIL